MSRQTAESAEADLESALYTSRALRLMLFDLEGEGLSAFARRAAAELALTVEMRLEEAREVLVPIEHYQRRGASGTGGA